MQRFTNALDECISSNNWYGSLFIALSLLDICGKFETPTLSSSQRYSNWFTANLSNKYSRKIGPNAELHVFLSGDDCYSLRCAYLHEGVDDIMGQRARDILERFRFVAPMRGYLVHLNQKNNILQLQVDIFCKDIAEAVNKWFDFLSKSKKDEISVKLAEIQIIGNTFFL